MDEKILEQLQDNINKSEQTDMLDHYDGWSNSYDKDLTTGDVLYNGHTFLAEAVVKHIPDRYARFMDVGSGSGLVAEALLNCGYSGNFDGLEPAKVFAKVATDKNLYKKVFHDFITDEPCSVPPGVYDAITVSGAIVPGHIHYASIKEFLRMCKLGGFVFIMMRKEYTDVGGPFSGMEDWLDEHEKKGDFILKEKYSKEDYFNKHTGLLIVLEKAK